jgi:hypothetical protein
MLGCLMLTCWVPFASRSHYVLRLSPLSHPL